jgi:diguanylate cyclase (GGDEF)-like protein
MTSSNGLLERFIEVQRALNSSLRLKDVLDAAAEQFSVLAGSAKVAIFLADNEGLAFKLMSSKGYSEGTVEQLRTMPFTAESMLKYVVQKRQEAACAKAEGAPDITVGIMQREQSQGQIVLPLLASNLLVGAVQIDLTKAENLGLIDFLKKVAELAAVAIANAILFGRSEFERERLNTLYKTSCALSSSVLRVSEVLQIAADTSLVLSNTPNCAILMADPASDSFRIVAFKGLDGHSLNEFDLTIKHSIAGVCLANNRTEYVPDANHSQFGLPRSTDGSEFGSVLALPLVQADEHLGVIMIFSTDQRAFQREQIELLESLMKQVSASLHVALTHESATSQAVQDAHTGLYNRWHFEDALAKEVERSHRHRRQLVIMLIDVDHLAHINDYFGQEKGDEAIKHVAMIIKDALRDIDIPCRYGGEEFGVILPETPPQNAFEVAERLRQKIRSLTAPGIGMVTVSIGLAAFPENAENAETLIKSAEQALDVAKFEGRDRVKMAQAGQPVTGPISWEELAKQARLSVVAERQSKIQHKWDMSQEYAPWMRNSASWVGRKKPGEKG